MGNQLCMAILLHGARIGLVWQLDQLRVVGNEKSLEGLSVTAIPGRIWWSLNFFVASPFSKVHQHSGAILVGTYRRLLRAYQRKNYLGYKLSGYGILAGCQERQSIQSLAERRHRRHGASGHVQLTDYLCDNSRDCPSLVLHPSIVICYNCCW